MPAWLMDLIAQISYRLLSWAVKDVTSFISAQQALDAQRKANQAAASASVDPLKKAQTPQEIDDAADSSLNGL